MKSAKISRTIPRNSHAPLYFWRYPHSDHLTIDLYDEKFIQLSIKE
jgi:hypothetical protein